MPIDLSIDLTFVCSLRVLRLGGSVESCIAYAAFTAVLRRIGVGLS